MKLIPLTQGKLAQVDDADYEYLSQFKWQAKRSRKTWYATRKEFRTDGKRIEIKMHRELLGAASDIMVDHRDLDGLNNRRYNLRQATHIQNGRNRGCHAGRRFKGTYGAGGRYAHIRVDKKLIYLGTFRSEEEAARAYDAAAIEYFGEWANLNFPVSEAA